MFTGIIRHTGMVERVEKTHGDARLFIRTTLDLSHSGIGASVSCAGCCLTVVDRDTGWFAADVSEESFSKTIIGTWEKGTRINLEPSLKAGDEMGGHLVFGHVDGLAVIEDIRIEGDSHRVKIRIPEDLSHLVAPKGSVALDGVSLTVNAVEGNTFGINVIPYTWIHTTLGERKAGDSLHFEADMLARYVARMLAHV